MTRRTGNTIKLLLRALSHALESDGSRCVLIFSGHHARNHALNTLWEMMSPTLSGFYVMRPTSGEVAFNNGSCIEFRDMDWVKDQRWYNLKADYLREDNSVDWASYDSKYKSLLEVLVDKVERDGGSTDRRN